MKRGMPDVLVLLDIDGTLLTTDGAGREAFSAAIKTVFGWLDDLAWVSFAGATDLGLLHTICGRYGRHPTAPEITEFFLQLAVELRLRLRPHRVRVLPGVRQFLALLQRRADVTVALLTGNSRSGAQIKLRSAGLDLEPLRGGFGDERADRCELARTTYEREGGAGRWRRVWVVGDTPADVRAAEAIHACSLAVATGHHSVAELGAAGATQAVNRLTEVLDLAFLG